MPSNLFGDIFITRKRQVLDSSFCYQTMLYKHVTSETHALVDNFGNNPTLDIRTQSYLGKIHDKEN